MTSDDWEPSKLLDRSNLILIEELQNNGRQSFSELARKTGLSLPSVSERVKKLEDAGVIRGYQADVNPATFGYELMAFMSIASTPDQYARFLRSIQDLSEVLECHHVAGGESFLLKVMARSILHLEELIGKLSAFGSTTTSIVLSSPIVRTKMALPRPKSRP